MADISLSIPAVPAVRSAGRIERQSRSNAQTTAAALDDHQAPLPRLGALRRRVPGFEHAYAVQSGTQIGRAMTSSPAAPTRLTSTIPRGAAPCSSDHPRAARTQPAALLIPRDIDGLLVAGRRISGSHVVHSSYRVTPIGTGDRPSRRSLSRARRPQEHRAALRRGPRRPKCAHRTGRQPRRRRLVNRQPSDRRDPTP